MSGVNGSLKGFNLYAYCFNNPIMLTDVSGNWPAWIKSATKWFFENIAAPIVNSIENFLANFDFTQSSGIAISFSPGIFTFSLQVAITTDSDGNIAFQYSFSDGITTGTPGISPSVFSSITNAPDYTQVENMGYAVGLFQGFKIGNVPVFAGGDMNFLPNANKTYYGLSGYFGLGGASTDIHGTLGSTGSIFLFNYFDTFDVLYKSVKEW
jgi:hypothetical protein